VAVGIAGCGIFSPDFSQVVAITVSADSTVAQGDTLQGTARALTAGGDTAMVPIIWSSFDAKILRSTDSTTGRFVGLDSGVTRIQARTGTLRSDPVSVHVLKPRTP
jgi:hypothetical protein